MENISKHISYREATRSQEAQRYNKSNDPTEVQLTAMRELAERVFEPVREHFGVPIVVSSFFRSRQVNALIGGSENSQHCKGEAMDIDHETLNADIFHFIREKLEFDQLIWEFGNDVEPAWVHVSLKAKGSKLKAESSATPSTSSPSRNRREVLRARKEGYRTVYERI